MSNDDDDAVEMSEQAKEEAAAASLADAGPQGGATGTFPIGDKRSPRPSTPALEGFYFRQPPHDSPVA